MVGDRIDSFVVVDVVGDYAVVDRDKRRRIYWVAYRSVIWSRKL